MKAITKVLIAVLLLAVVMAILPWVAMQPLQIGIDFMFVCLFILNPLLSIILGLMSGTDLRKLWWLPFAMALVFPLLLGIVLGQIVVELYVYAAAYLLVGILAMLGMHLIRVLRSKRKKRRLRRKFDKRGFDHNHIHKNGTKYDDYGFDYYGYSAAGYNLEGYNRDGKNREGKYDRFRDTRSQEEEGFYDPFVYPVALTTHARERFAERLGIYDDRKMNDMTFDAYSYGKSKRQLKKTSAYLIDEIERAHENGILLIHKNYIYVFSRENVLITVYKNDRIPM